jgi:hypothetical protein
MSKTEIIYEDDDDVRSAVTWVLHFRPMWSRLVDSLANDPFKLLERCHDTALHLPAESDN